MLRSRYGLDIASIEAMYAQQDGCCAICGTAGDRPAVDERRATRKGVLCVDHDHQTGAVRGLLCTNCNVGLGKFGDAVDRLVKAAKYLTDNKE